MENSRVVRDFINQVWNNRAFEKLDDFLHPDFRDFSLPPGFSTGKDGTRDWITNTGASFEHFTMIEDLVKEGDRCIVKLSMRMKHIGRWRGIEPTSREVETPGYRYFKLKEGRIIEHRALIDGQAIEKQLK